MNYIHSFFKNYFLSYKGIPMICWFGIVLSFFESSLGSVYYFFSFYFIENLHFTISAAGILVSCYGLGTILGGFIGGQLCDRFSPTKVMVIGLFLQALSFAILLFIHQKLWLAMDLFGCGFGAYFFITAN